MIDEHVPVANKIFADLAKTDRKVQIVSMVWHGVVHTANLIQMCAANHHAESNQIRNSENIRDIGCKNILKTHNTIGCWTDCGAIRVSEMIQHPIKPKARTLRNEGIVVHKNNERSF